MSLPIRMILILMMVVAIPAGLLAQEATSTAATSTIASETVEIDEATAADEAVEEPAPGLSTDETAESRRPSSYDTRNQLSQLLRRSPPELARVLSLDPTLLTNETYLSGYPDLAEFVEAHPEVLRNPRFYLGEFQEVPRDSVIGDVVEGIAIFATFAGIALALGWFVRTVIEQKRWSRLNKTQTEVHTKLLDRFGSTDELLAYIKTPAGSKFLESAPIPLYAEQRTPKSAPMSRVMLSIQIGVVIAALGLGMITVGAVFGESMGNELFALGMIALWVGIGFIASAAISIFLTRKLGLLGTDGHGLAAASPSEDPGLMR